MALYNHYNNEDVLIRAILAGLLDILNNQIKYTQVWGNSDDEIETISIPWSYNSSGDERFNQDFYTKYAECMPPRPIDGNFYQIPRGAITYIGSSISAQRITSRYVQGRYIKEIDGQLESYVSYLYSIPLNIRIDCEMWVDRQITALKIEQEIREVFYKTKTFYVYYKGMRIGSTVGFPEDTTLEKNINYSFEADNKIKVTFQLEIESYQPVFDPTAEMKASSKIKNFSYNVFSETEDKSLNPSLINITTPKENAVIPKGIPIWVEWSGGSNAIKVNIQWCLSGENDLEAIELHTNNHEFFVWNVPTDFTDFKEPVIVWEEDSSISVYKKPIVKIIPDLNTNLITSSSFTLVDEGYFLCAADDASINIQLEMKDNSGNVSYSTDGSIWANVKNHVLDVTTPVSVSGGILFPGTVNTKVIDIHVTDSNNTDAIGILNHITIV
jgi:hypothetical protein